MKELNRRTIFLSEVEGLTRHTAKSYSRYGDDFMAAEPGQGENLPQQPTGRLEGVTRQGKQGQASAAGDGGRSGGEGRTLASTTPEGGNRKPEQPPSSFQQEQQKGNQAEELRKLQESLKSIEDISPKFKGISEDVIKSLQGDDPRRRLEEVYRDFLIKYQNLESEMTKAYAEKKYEGENVVQQPQEDDNKYMARKKALIKAQIQADSKEYLARTEALREAQKKMIGILGERVSARTRLSPEGQSAVKTIKELKKLIDDKDIPEDIKRNLRKDLQAKALEVIEEVDPENEPISEETLRAIGADDFASEKFISKIINLPSEDKPYRLHGLYTDVNVNRFLIVNTNWMESGKLERLDDLVRATETIHEMNRILKTSVDQFAQVSQTILSSHLSTLFGVHGVQDVFELYEGVIKENLSIETMITDDVFKAIDEQVKEEFKGRKEDDFKKGVSKKVTSLKGEGGLEDWEVERALIYGRNLQRTLLQEAGYIYLSNLPKGPRTFISLAQGQLLNIFHAVKYTLQRFKPGESQGGIEMLEEVLEEAAEKRRHGRNKEENKGIVRLSILQGTGVGDREATKIIGARGAIMTWRASEAILREFAILDNGQASNIAQFFADHGKEIAALNEISSNNAWTSEFKRTNKQVNGTIYNSLEAWKTARIEQVFGQLLKNNAAVLGVLVSPVALEAPMPTEVKQMLWKKIAELNPDVMASILTRLEVDEKAEGADQLQNVKSLEQILLPHFGTDEQKSLLLVNGEWKPTSARRDLARLGEEYNRLEGELAKATAGSDKDRLRGELERRGKEFDAKKKEFDILDNQVKKLLRHKDWKTLRSKLRMINRLRMLDETARMKQVKAFQEGKLSVDLIRSPKSFQDYLDDLRLEEDKLTADERVIVTAISENGKRIAPDLANIKQATIWFLDDLPTDISKWENLGQFFNRMIGDFGQFSQSSTEMVKFLANPFKIPVQQALEYQAKAIDAAGQVLGIEAAQDNQNIIVMGYNRWIQTYPRYEQVILEMIASARYKFTSKAQEVTRDTGAPSLSKENMFSTLLTQNNKSILRGEKPDKYGKIQFTDSFKAAVKELKVGVWDRVFLQNIKDWGPFFFLGILLKLLKESASDTKR